MIDQSPIVPQQFQAIFEDKQIYNEKFVHYSFELKNPHRLQFKAGQYLSLAIDAQGKRRAYSIINPPSIDHGVELLVEPVSGGAGTAYLTNLQFGNEVSFLAPLGMFTIDFSATEAEQEIFLIATGSGIAPLRSMLLDLIDKQDKRPIHLYWGLRFVEHLIWEDEFQRLEESFPNFHFHPVISKAPDAWTLSRGRVTEILSVLDLPTSAGYYVCGSAAMVKDTFEILKQKGVADSLLHKENFDL